MTPDEILAADAATLAAARLRVTEAEDTAEARTASAADEDAALHAAYAANDTKAYDALLRAQSAGRVHNARPRFRY